MVTIVAKSVKYLGQLETHGQAMHSPSSILHLALIFFVCTISPSMQSYVNPYSACEQVGELYTGGCSELTAALLGQPFKQVIRHVTPHSHHLLQASFYRQRAPIGSNGRYSGVSPGEIIGFSGHVGVYIGGVCGGSRCIFVDVERPGKRARCLSSYGSTRVYKYDY